MMNLKKTSMTYFQGLSIIGCIKLNQTKARMESVVTVTEFIEKLKAIDCPDAIVRIFDADSKKMEPVSCFLFDKNEVDLQSDI